MRKPLPSESFADLASELAIIARDKATAAEAGELMVATIEARAEKESGAEVRHVGMRSSVAMLRQRALLAGRAADLLAALAPREAEVRRIVADFNHPF
jgi:hypothetical protein